MIHVCSVFVRCQTTGCLLIHTSGSHCPVFVHWLLPGCVCLEALYLSTGYYWAVCVWKPCICPLVTTGLCVSGSHCPVFVHWLLLGCVCLEATALCLSTGYYWAVCVWKPCICPLVTTGMCVSGSHCPVFVHWLLLGCVCLEATALCLSTGYYWAVCVWKPCICPLVTTGLCVSGSHCPVFVHWLLLGCVCLEALYLSTGYYWAVCVWKPLPCVCPLVTTGMCVSGSHCPVFVHWLLPGCVCLEALYLSTGYYWAVCVWKPLPCVCPLVTTWLCVWKPLPCVCPLVTTGLCVSGSPVSVHWLLLGCVCLEATALCLSTGYYWAVCCLEATVLCLSTGYYLAVCVWKPLPCVCPLVTTGLCVSGSPVSVHWLLLGCVCLDATALCLSTGYYWAVCVWKPLPCVCPLVTTWLCVSGSHCPVFVHWLLPGCVCLEALCLSTGYYLAVCVWKPLPCVCPLVTTWLCVWKPCVCPLVTTGLCVSGSPVFVHWLLPGCVCLEATALCLSTGYYLAVCVWKPLPCVCPLVTTWLCVWKPCVCPLVTTGLCVSGSHCPVFVHWLLPGCVCLEATALCLSTGYYWAVCVWKPCVFPLVTTGLCVSGSHCPVFVHWLLPGCVSGSHCPVFVHWLLLGCVCLEALCLSTGYYLAVCVWKPLPCVCPLVTTWLCVSGSHCPVFVHWLLPGCVSGSPVFVHWLLLGCVCLEALCLSTGYYWAVCVWKPLPCVCPLVTTWLCVSGSPVFVHWLLLGCVCLEATALCLSTGYYLAVCVWKPLPCVCLLVTTRLCVWKPLPCVCLLVTTGLCVSGSHCPVFVHWLLLGCVCLEALCLSTGYYLAACVWKPLPCVCPLVTTGLCVSGSPVFVHWLLPGCVCLEATALCLSTGYYLAVCLEATALCLSTGYYWAVCVWKPCVCPLVTTWLCVSGSHCPVFVHWLLPGCVSGSPVFVHWLLLGCVCLEALCLSTGYYWAVCVWKPLPCVCPLVTTWLCVSGSPVFVHWLLLGCVCLEATALCLSTGYYLAVCVWKPLPCVCLLVTTRLCVWKPLPCVCLLVTTGLCVSGSHCPVFVHWLLLGCVCLEALCLSTGYYLAACVWKPLPCVCPLVTTGLCVSGSPVFVHWLLPGCMCLEALCLSTGYYWAVCVWKPCVCPLVTTGLCLSTGYY